MTAIGEALEKLKYLPRDVALDRAIALYLNSGGTIDEVRKRVELAAKRMPGMGHGVGVSNDQMAHAQTRQPVDDGEATGLLPQGHFTGASPSSPVEDGGATKDLPQGHRAYAPPSSSSSVGGDPVARASPGQPPSVTTNANPDRGGRDHMVNAQKSQPGIVPPVREPSAAYLKAAGESRLQAARSILYRYTTSTGQFWGDVHPYEVGSMTRDHLRGIALMSALGPLNPKQMKMTFAELMTPKQAQIAMEKADKELVNVG